MDADPVLVAHAQELHETKERLITELEECTDELRKVEVLFEMNDLRIQMTDLAGRLRDA